MRANLQRALPGLGEAVLVQQSKVPVSQAVAQGRLQQRHAAYVEAFQRLGVHRHMAHAEMSRPQVQLELLVGNHSVGSSADGSMLTAVGSLPASLRLGAGTTLGQVQQQLSLQPATDQIVLPGAWQHILQQGDAGQWQVDSQQQWVQQSTEQGTKVFKVRQDGSLVDAAGEQMVLPNLSWVPCCVVDVTKPLHPAYQLLQQQQQQQQQLREQQQQQQQQQADDQQREMLQQQQQDDQQGEQRQQRRPQQRHVGPALFLVGPWTGIKVDPSVWGLGYDMGIMQFRVKDATQRLLQHHCAQHHRSGWVPGVGMRPRIWRDRAGVENVQQGLAELEAAQKRSFEDMLQGGMQSSSRSSGSQRFSDALLLEAYHAPWMDPSPPRDLPRQRAAAAAAVITVQRQQQALQQQLQVSNPVHDDLQDPLTQQLGPVDTSSFSWVSAYRRAGHRRLPRQLRVFGWRLLHAGVKVGARRMVAARRAEPCQFACQAQPCQAQQQLQLETLSHLFVQCPVAAAVWQWFAAVWQQVQPGAAVPVSNSRVLLLDDSSEWAPPQDKEQLWTYMRLLLLESIWAVRSSCQGSNLVSSTPGSSSGSTGGSAGSQGEGPGRSGSPAYTAKAVACRFKAELQQQMRRDWMRVGVDVRLGSGVPMAWLKGPSPIIELAKFWFRWGALFTVGDDGEVAVAISTAGL